MDYANLEYRRMHEMNERIRLRLRQAEARALLLQHAAEERLERARRLLAATQTEVGPPTRGA